MKTKIIPTVNLSIYYEDKTFFFPKGEPITRSLKEILPRHFEDGIVEKVTT